MKDYYRRVLRFDFQIWAMTSTKSSKTAKGNSRVDRAKERSPVVRRLRQPRSTHEGSGQLRWVASLYASGNVLFHLVFLGQLITC